MATWQNLVDESNGDALQEACIEYAQEGTDWTFYSPVYTALDDTGAYTDVDLTGVTAVWKIYDELDGTVLLTLATSVVENQIKGTATKVATAGLGGSQGQGRPCPWSLKLTKAGVTLPAWGPQDSLLIIKQGD